MATVVNTIRYFPDARYTDLPTGAQAGGFLGGANRFNSTSKTLTIAETGSREFLSVTLWARFRDRFTVANEITSVRMGIKLGSAAFADTDRTFTQANTGDHCNEVWALDVTDYFTSNFGSGTTQTCQCALEVLSTAASNVNGTVWFQLDITYRYDNTVGSTRTKSIPIPIQSHHAAPGTSQVEIGTTGGVNNAPANQIPALDTYLEESGKTFIDAAIVWQSQAIATTADTTPYVQIDSATEVAQGVIGQVLNTATIIEGIYNYSTSTFSTSSAHAYKMRTDLAAAAPCVGAIMWVTFTYASTSGRATYFGILAAECPLGGMPWGGPSPTTSVAADASTFTAEIDIQETGPLTLKQSASYFVVDTNGIVTVSVIGSSDRVYTPTNQGTHFLCTRRDHDSSWSISRGVNRLSCKVYQSTYPRATIEGIFIVVYSAATTNGVDGGNRSVQFLTAQNGTAISNAIDIAASGGGQRQMSFGSNWSMSSLLFAVNAKATQTVFALSNLVFADASDPLPSGTTWIYGARRHIAFSAADMMTRPTLASWTRKYKRSSLSSEYAMSPLTLRREMISAANANAAAAGIASFIKVATIHNVTFSVAGILTIDGAAAANGKTIKIWAYDSSNIAEYITSTTTSGGAGAFTATVLDDTRTYFCTHQLGDDNGISASGTPGSSSFDIEIRAAPPTGSATAVTSSADEIRAAIVTGIAALSPAAPSKPRFVPYREEMDFRAWCEKNPTACLRRFSVAFAGASTPPEVSTTLIEWIGDDVEIVVAYPTDGRHGGDYPLRQLDAVIAADMALIDAEVGGSGYQSRSTTAALGTISTIGSERENGPPVTFGVLRLRAEFYRSITT